MLTQQISKLCVGLDEAQAYSRVETGEEEALLAGLLRTSSEVCESFVNLALLEREFTQMIQGSEGWTMLAIQPVRSITSVRQKGDQDPLPAAAYRADSDHEGRAFLSGLEAGATYEVSGTAGMAADPNGVPEPIRQGILRLTAHLFANRDNPNSDMPAAVTALWRPYRRAGLCR